jgi:hypothetical protein
MTKQTRRIVLGVVGAMIALVATAVPASAAVFKATYEAGYYTGAPAVPVEQSASTQFKLPTITCKTGQNAAVDPEAEVFGSTPVAVQAGVRLKCVAGKASYQPQLLINGTRTFPALVVKVGDTISESAMETSTHSTVTIKDVTTGKSATKSGGGGKDTSCSIVMGRVSTTATSSTAQPIPKFGPLTFTSSKINGKAVGSLNWGSNDMYSGTVNPPPASAHLLISVSNLSAGGTTFTATFKASS